MKSFHNNKTHSINLTNSNNLYTIIIAKIARSMAAKPYSGFFI